MKWPHSSGLAGLAADIVDALASVRFARPEALWLLLLIPALCLLDWFAAISCRRTANQIGLVSAMRRLVVHPNRGFWHGLGYGLSLVGLIVGLAGPRWGKSAESGVAVGRDIIVVIDLSRSMLAEDMTARSEPSRWQAARAGVFDLIDAVSRRGGDRVGLVVFAAKPKLLSPLTTDYEYLRTVVFDLDGRFPPPECRPRGDATAVSGTRIGAALATAVAAQDGRFSGQQDIVLISDGDDPAHDDEWRLGIEAARRDGIPVHTVGVGDAATPAFIPLENGLLETAGADGLPELVATRLEEPILRQIAVETRGRYVAAGRDSPRLADLYHAVIEPGTSRTVSDDTVPQLAERYQWFLAPALGLLLLSGCGRRT